MALALGKTVRQLLEEIGADELLEWQAYSALEPFGEERADLRAGIVACVTANTARTKKSKAYKPKDFMPKFGPPKKQSVENMKTLLMALAAASTEQKKRQENKAQQKSTKHRR